MPWRKKEAVHLGVNFTNILPTDFLYKSVLQSSSLHKVWLCKFLAEKYGRKNSSYNVGEIDGRRKGDTLEN